MVINLVALRGKVLLSFGTGERFTVRALESRDGRAECTSVVVAACGMCQDGRLATAKPNRHLRYPYPLFRRAATAHSEREPLTLNRHSNYNASSAAARAADV